MRFSLIFLAFMFIIIPTVSALYDMCATLLLYSGPDCEGEPVKHLTFPTSTEPGSPCYHDSHTMAGYAVKNQFCGNDFFQQDIYQGNECVDGASYNTQVFKSIGCIHGYKFGSCVPGPCPTTTTTTTTDDASQTN